MLRETSILISLIWDLAKNDFQTKYAGSFLGVAWSVIQPLITILVYWIVFQYGLKVSMANMDVPYILWFMTGMIPWLFFADCVGNGVNCLKEYNYLVKKILFPVEILPMVKLVASLFVHVVFIILLTVLCMVYNTFFEIRIFQVLYFAICLSLIIYIWLMFSSSILVFFKDFGQVIQIVLQVGMWATPILWDYHRIPEQYLWIMEINPLFYIVEGYRGAFLGSSGIYPSAFRFWYFWISSLIMLFLSIYVFAKLKKHFADIL